MNLVKNDIIKLNITSATAEGNGVGKTEDGIAVFVPLSAVGDELEVRILKTKKTYAFGKIESLHLRQEQRQIVRSFQNVAAALGGIFHMMRSLI